MICLVTRTLKKNLECDITFIIISCFVWGFFFNATLVCLYLYLQNIYSSFCRKEHCLGLTQKIICFLLKYGLSNLKCFVFKHLNLLRVASAVVPWEHLEKKNLRGNLSCGKVSLRLENKETFHPTYLSKMLCIWFVSVPVPSNWHLVLRAFPHVEQAVRLYRKTAKVFKRLKKTFLKGFNKNIGWAVVMGCRLVQPHPLISEGLHLTGSSLYPSRSYFLPPPLFCPDPLNVP